MRLRTPMEREFLIPVLSLLTCLLAANAVHGQRSSATKPFSQWSKQDVEIILNNSPWAITQEVRIRYAGEARPVAGGPAPTAGTSNRSDANTISSAGAEAPVDFQFTLRLRSALPVRQAIVRLKQIEAKYDKMEKKDQAAFDAKTKGVLDCPACAQNYVLTLSSRSQQNPGADAVFSLYKGARLEDLQRYIYLINDRGERRPLIHFVPPKVPGEEATFFFPRLDDRDLPLLDQDSKELIFNLTNNEVNAVTNFKIDVGKLLIDGKIQF
jgi:hypothetical protein